MENPAHGLGCRLHAPILPSLSSSDIRAECPAVIIEEKQSTKSVAVGDKPYRYAVLVHGCLFIRYRISDIDNMVKADNGQYVPVLPRFNGSKEFVVTGEFEIPIEIELLIKYPYLHQ